MRTILVPTDFSKPAKNAAYFALNLAMAMKTDLHLCHAFIVPADSPMLGGVAWALYEFPDLQVENTKALKKFADVLEKKGTVLLEDDPSLFQPSISYTCDEEDVAHFINRTAAKTDTVLIVMGMTGAGKLDQFIFGSNTTRMIEQTQRPLLIIPHNLKYNSIKKIAFATDLSNKDKKTAQALAKFAQYFDAELLISHVIDFGDMLDDKAYQQKKERFIENIDGKTSYLPIEVEGIDSGLDVLKNKDLDMLVMGHQHKGFFDRLTKGSHALRQVRDLQIPLLIIPDGVPVLF